jgi:hypothetical protein
MMLGGYNEDHLIEQPTMQLMQDELAWEAVNCHDEPSAPKLQRSGWNPVYQRLIANLPAVEKGPKTRT